MRNGNIFPEIDAAIWKASGKEKPAKKKRQIGSDTVRGPSSSKSHPTVPDATILAIRAASKLHSIAKVCSMFPDLHPMYVRHVIEYTVRAYVK